MRSLALGIAGGALLASAASAAPFSVVFTDSIGLTQTAYTRTLTVPQFDPTTIPFSFLTSVTVEVDSMIDASYNFTCFVGDCTATSGLMSGNYISATTNLSGPGTSLSVGVETGNFGPLAIPGDENGVDPNNPAFPAFLASGLTASGSDSTSINSGLGAFTGPGFIDFIVSGSGFRADQLVGAANSGAVVLSDAAITVTYHYDLDTPPPPPNNEIPVPAALPLLVSAIAGLGVFRKFRKSS